MRRVWLVRFFPVTVDDGIDVHVSASYFQAQGVRKLQLVSKFGRPYNILGEGEIRPYNIRRILCALLFYPFLILFCFFTFPFLIFIISI
jgi:hypothetical protein